MLEKELEWLLKISGRGSILCFVLSMEEKNQENLTQKNSPMGEFLQSEVWRNFQESVGRKTFHVEGDNFWANITEHMLPIIGKYFYIPRGPILKISNFEFQTLFSGRQVSNQIQDSNEKKINRVQELIDLAGKNNAGWIRIDPKSEEVLKVIRGNLKYKIVKAPHDMQPKEIFVIDIAKSEEELLAQMKAKTRYNIRLAEKKGVEVKISNFQFPISNQIQNPNDKNYIEEFLRLTTVMAKRQGIVAHPAEYYRKMFETISGDILKLYVAEYRGKIIAANLVVFYGETCIYLHGASDDEFRNVMAPYLLQWQQIRDAKKAGCVKYDFGGVSMSYQSSGKHGQVGISKWIGITKFKLGFSPKTSVTMYPGSYDIIFDSVRYGLYRLMQAIKSKLK